MYIEDIRKAWEAGEYNASINMDIPAKVKEDYVFDENLSVKENRKMAIEHNEMVANMWKELWRKEAELNKKLRNDVIDYIVEYYSMNRTQAEIIERYVYENYHSFIYDYFSYIDEITSMVEEILKVEKE